jgi:hypothetical protein
MTADDRPLLPHDARRGFRLTSPDDWRALLRTRANVLVMGPEQALETFVRAAQSDLREPIRSTACGQTLSLEWARTLILRDVHQLDAAGQQALLAWLNRRENADTQIVSVTSVPLFASVQANRFDCGLYYRLNTVHFEVRPPD